MAVEEKQAKAARNQALFREVNERVREITDAGALASNERIGFICECADPACTETIELTHEEYEAARSTPTHFPTALGHEWPDVEHVVERSERYQVVEKVGEAARVAIHAASRETS